MQPYVSIVIAASNEGYGGNFLERMQGAVNSILSGAMLAAADIELVIVDWGTPPDRLGMETALNYTQGNAPVRVIKVPRALVKSIPNPRGIKFFEPWAKSVGVRRATGEFILTTNADSIHHRKLFEIYATRTLGKGYFYRVNRVDCRGGDPYAINRANGTFKIDDPWENISLSDVPYSPDMLHFNASGEFIMMSREAYHGIHGWPELDYWGSVDGQVVWLAHEYGLKQHVFQYPLYHEDHARETGADKWNPGWTDGKPFATKNGDGWGFRDHKFEEIIVRA
jgi:hypothetical protein